MRMTRKVTCVSVLAAALFALCTLQPAAVSAGELRLSSKAFENGADIPTLYSCQGENKSPPLAIDGVPTGTKSLALVMDDPDAPGGTWVHWVLWNLDPATGRIDARRVPKGAGQGSNSWQRKGYGGPCPPSGQHRYYFRLYALSQRLTLPSGSTGKDLERAMQGKVLARSELMGVYGARR